MTQGQFERLAAAVRNLTLALYDINGLQGFAIQLSSHTIDKLKHERDAAAFITYDHGMNYLDFSNLENKELEVISYVPPRLSFNGVPIVAAPPS